MPNVANVSRSTASSTSLAMLPTNIVFFVLVPSSILDCPIRHRVHSERIVSVRTSCLLGE